MDHAAVITSQYLAALEMLKQSVVKCPEALWNSPDDKTKFWHIAYHALFYTHLYLAEPGKTSRRGRNIGRSMSSSARCRGRLMRRRRSASLSTRRASSNTWPSVSSTSLERVPQLDLEAGSGFGWLPFGKLELQFYNIRHLQQHTGELMERLGTRASIDVNWVGRVSAA